MVRVRWRSGREPFADPVTVFQPVLDAVVQAAGTTLPEFDQTGRDDVATPVRGAGNVQRVPGAAPAQMAMGFAMAQEMMRGMQGGMAPAHAFGTQAAGGAGQGMSGGMPSGQGTARGEEQGPNVVPGRGDAPGTLSGATVAGEAAGLDGLTVLTPGQAAALLSVPEEDVMASIQAGDLKARKIGSAWRIARSALDEFLRG